MKISLTLDGDNTLWDTDAVFRRAQIALLEPFARAELITQPALQLETLRIVDQALVSKLGKFEYDFRLLPVALAFFYAEALTVSASVDAATVHENLTMKPELAGVVEEAYQAFTTGIEAIPDLYPDAIPVLNAIRETVSSPLVTILFSEGKVARVERILEFHDLRRQGLFDAIVLAPKNEATFKQVKEAGLQLLPSDDQEAFFIMVGDSLHRDISLGNRAGFTTIYKPSAFRGLEVPKTPEERPSYSIQSLSELPLILMQIIKG